MLGRKFIQSVLAGIYYPKLTGESAVHRCGGRHFFVSTASAEDIKVLGDRLSQQRR